METPIAFNSSGNTSGYSFGPNWTTPERVELNECENSIEMIYKQSSYYNVSPCPQSIERVYKIIFSCIDGKWNKSEPIYGEIVPAQEEYYEFEE